jgi:hypothetical protein
MGLAGHQPRGSRPGNHAAVDDVGPELAGRRDNDRKSRADVPCTRLDVLPQRQRPSMSIEDAVAGIGFMIAPPRDSYRDRLRGTDSRYGIG